MHYTNTQPHITLNKHIKQHKGPKGGYHVSNCILYVVCQLNMSGKAELSMDRFLSKLVCWRAMLHALGDNNHEECLQIYMLEGRVCDMFGGLSQCFQGKTQGWKHCLVQSDTDSENGQNSENDPSNQPSREDNSVFKSSDKDDDNGNDSDEKWNVMTGKL